MQRMLAEVIHERPRRQQDPFEPRERCANMLVGVLGPIRAEIFRLLADQDEVVVEEVVSRDLQQAGARAKATEIEQPSSH